MQSPWTTAGSDSRDYSTQRAEGVNGESKATETTCGKMEDT